MNLYSQLFLYQALTPNLYPHNTKKTEGWSNAGILPDLASMKEFTNFRKPTIFENATCTNVLWRHKTIFAYQLFNRVQGKNGKRWSTLALTGVNSYALVCSYQFLQQCADNGAEWQEEAHQRWSKWSTKCSGLRNPIAKNDHLSINFATETSTDYCINPGELCMSCTLHCCANLQQHHHSFTTTTKQSAALRVTNLPSSFSS